MRCYCFVLAYFSLSASADYQHQRRALDTNTQLVSQKSPLHTSASRSQYGLHRRGNEGSSGGRRESRPGSGAPPLPRFPSPSPTREQGLKRQRKQKTGPRISVKASRPAYVATVEGRHGPVQSHQAGSTEQLPAKGYASHSAHVAGLVNAPTEQDSSGRASSPIEIHGQGRSVQLTVSTAAGRTGFVQSQLDGESPKYQTINGGTTFQKTFSSHDARGARIFASASRPSLIKIKAKDAPKGVRYGHPDSPSSTEGDAWR